MGSPIEFECYPKDSLKTQYFKLYFEYYCHRLSVLQSLCFVSWIHLSGAMLKLVGK